MMLEYRDCVESQAMVAVKHRDVVDSDHHNGLAVPQPVSRSGHACHCGGESPY